MCNPNPCLMNKTKAKLDFRNLPDTKFEPFSKNVITKMTANANYPTSVVYVAEAQELHDQYTALLTQSAYGNPAVIAEKNAVKILLENKLAQICELTNFVTPNNRPKLLTTGFNLTKEVSQPRVTGPLKSVTVTNWLNLGEVKVVAKKGEGTDSVAFSYAIADTLGEITAWIPCPGIGCTCIISGLPSGKRVFIQAAALGPRKQVIYSTPVSTIVL
jgi:hypothetical protein